MSKLINISDELYRKLKGVKGNRSFTVVIEGLLKKRSNKDELLSFAGRIDFDERRMKELKKGWNKWSEKYA
jgi:predicted CopG family antitoxin